MSWNMRFLARTPAAAAAALKSHDVPADVAQFIAGRLAEIDVPPGHVLEVASSGGFDPAGHCDLMVEVVELFE